jgi:hypothetical protein
MERKENRRKDEEMKKLKAEMEQKDKDTDFFRDQAKHHQARAQELEKTRERFQVENKGKKDKLTDSQIAKYEMMMTEMFGECAGYEFDVCAYSDLCILSPVCDFNVRCDETALPNRDSERKSRN